MWRPKEGFLLDGEERWNDPSSKVREQDDAGWRGGMDNHGSSVLERTDGWTRGHVDRLALGAWTVHSL